MSGGLAAGGPLSLLIDRTLAGVVSSAFVLPAGFSSYLMQFIGLTLDAVTNGLVLQYSTDGGVTPLATSYVDSFRGVTSGGADVTGSGTATGIPIGGATGAANTLDLDGQLVLTRFNNAGLKARVQGEVSYGKGGAAVFESVLVFGMRDVAAAYNAVVLSASAGANLAGRVRLLGNR